VVSGVINLPFMMQRVLSHSCLEKLQVLPLHRGLGNHIIPTWSNITPPAADPRERPPGHVFFGLFPSLNWSGDRVWSGDDVEILHSCRKGMSGGTSVAQHDTAHSPCCTQGYSNRYLPYLPHPVFIVQTLLQIQSDDENVFVVDTALCRCD